MKQLFVAHLLLLLGVAVLSPAAPAQDMGGRDPGRGDSVVIFVRWRTTAESFAVYDTAWRALEPFRTVSKRRLLDFDGDPERARGLMARNADAVLAVALDRESAGAVRELAPKIAVLEVSPGALAQVDTHVDRERFARVLRRFHATARRVRAISPRHESLPRFEIVESGEDLVWVAEGGRLEPGSGALVVSTSPDLAEGAAALTVRPDPRSVGLRVAADVVRMVRDGKSVERGSVARLLVSVDLRAARAAGYRVPLDLLARADAVRRPS